MQFALSSEQEMIADLAGQLLTDRASSLSVRAAMDAGGFDAGLWEAFAGEAQLAALAVPEAHGGAGLGLVEMALVAEAAGRHLAALPIIASLGLAAPALAAGGSEAQKADWLPLLASGEAIGTFADLDEADFNDGGLTGVARLVPHGRHAGLILLRSGEALWLVARGEGTACDAQTSLDLTRPLDRLVLDRVPAEPLADPAGAIRALERWGWTLIAADALGGAQACLERTAAYARERVQFGRPIGTFQAVKHALADIAVAVEQARSAVYWAAAEAAESPEARMAAHAAKAVACETYAQAAAAMIQLHGGMGFTWEHDAHLFFKRAQSDRSWMGLPEWHWGRIADLMALEAA